MKLKKAAFYINSLDKGGAQRVIVNLSEFLLKNGVEVVIVTTRKAVTEYDISDAVLRVYSEIADHEVTSSRILNLKNRISKLRRIWKLHNPDIIISFIGKNNFMAIISSLFLKIPVAVSVRGEPTAEYDNKVLQFLAKHLFLWAKGIIFQTEDAKMFFPKSVRKKSIILPNPLNTDCMRARYAGVRENVIVAVGRVDNNKNHKMLIDAFAKNAARFPDTLLYIYGEGECRQALIAYSKQLGLEHRISLPGNVNDVPGKIWKARIFVLTSDTEGMPNSLMEAMALGLAVISTDCPCGGPKTLIRDGDNGILVPVRDTVRLEEALQRILSDRELENRLGEKAFQIQEDLSPEKVNRGWMTYLQKLL